MPQQIIIDISPEGNVKIDAEGFTDSSCAVATHELEVALGGGLVRKEKPGFNTPATGGNVENRRTF